MLAVGGLQTLWGVLGVSAEEGVVVTTIEITFELAVVGLEHGLLLVIKQLTLSPFKSAVVLKVFEEPLATVVLFTSHW